MPESKRLVQSERPEYYYDLSGSQVLVGRMALVACLESGGHPSDIVELGQYLRADSEIDSGIETINPRRWNKKDSLNYGKWLLGSALYSNETDQKSLNQNVIYRAWQLGLGPGPWKLASQFGSISEYYLEIGAGNTHRIGVFDDWTLEDYVSYVRQVGHQVGKRPTLSEFKARSARDGRNPNPQLMYKRFKDIGGIRKLQELAGYPVIDFWEDQDYIDWGVKFMRANEGKRPAARMIDFLSRKNHGPSSYPVQKKFGGVKNYQSIVEKYYRFLEIERNEQIQTKLQAISQELAAGKIPKKLFLGAKSETERLSRAAQYRVAKELLGKNYLDSVLTIGLGKISIIGGIRKSNSTITPGDIESTALYLGVFDDIWPMDDFLEDLKLGEEYEEYDRLARQRRKERETELKPLIAKTV